MSTSPDPGVLRATRVELVDDDGLVRAIVGRLGRDLGSDGYGVMLFDGAGRTRAWLSLEASGPVLGFDQDGNLALHLGVDDATADALHVGGFIHLADRFGQRVASWMVEEDGSLTVHQPGDPV